jgi:hypothetical protein
MTRRSSTSVSAVMTGAALAAVALGSAAQVALYLHHFGVSHRTDGFIAAFAVYSLVVVVAQILRTTAVPLLSGTPPRLDGGAFAWAIVALAALTALLGLALAVPLARVVANSTGPAGRQVAAASIRIMAVAAGLQFIAAGLAVRGAVQGRLVRVALAYMASAAAGLVAFFPLQNAAQQRVLAWTTLVASTVLVVAMMVAVAVPSWQAPRAGATVRAAFAVLRTAPVPAAFVLMYPIALALAPRTRAGDITVFGLAFTACSYLAGFTGQGLSMVDAVELARLAPDETVRRSAVSARAFRFSMLVAAPGLCVVALVGAPVVHALSTSVARAHASFGADVLRLAPWTVATLGLWATLPVVLAHLGPRVERSLDLGVLGLLVVHVAAVLLGRAIDGLDGVMVAMAVAPMVFVLAMLRFVVRPAAGAFARDAVRVVALAAIGYGLLWLVCQALLGPGVAGGSVAAALGSLAYGAMAALAFPEAVRTVRALLQRSQVPTVRGPAG